MPPGGRPGLAAKCASEQADAEQPPKKARRNQTAEQQFLKDAAQKLAASKQQVAKAESMLQLLHKGNAHLAGKEELLEENLVMATGQLAIDKKMHEAAKAQVKREEIQCQLKLAVSALVRKAAETANATDLQRALGLLAEPNDDCVKINEWLSISFRVRSK